MGLVVMANPKLTEEWKEFVFGVKQLKTKMYVNRQIV